MPAKAGIQSTGLRMLPWAAAFAGATNWRVRRISPHCLSIGVKPQLIAVGHSLGVLPLRLECGPLLQCSCV